MQNEKRKMLMEHETLKLKQREDAFTKDLREWKAQLKPRKQVTLKILNNINTNVTNSSYSHFLAMVNFHLNALNQ